MITPEILTRHQGHNLGNCYLIDSKFVTSGQRDTYLKQSRLELVNGILEEGSQLYRFNSFHLQQLTVTTFESSCDSQ